MATNNQPASDKPREAVRKSICSICGQSFLKPQLLAAHKRTKHPGGQRQGHTKRKTTYKAKTFTCPECGKRYVNGPGLGSHRLRAHGITGMARSTQYHRESAKKSGFSCPECGETFTFAKTLGIHRRGKHGVVGTSPSAIRNRELRQIAANNLNQPLKGVSRNGSSAGTTHGTATDEIAIAFWTGRTASLIDQLIETTAARLDVSAADFAARCLEVLSGHSKAVRQRYRISDRL